MKRPSFGTVEWCPVTPQSFSVSSTINPLAQTQAAPFFEISRSTLSSRGVTPDTTATTRQCDDKTFIEVQGPELIRPKRRDDEPESKISARKSPRFSRTLAIPGYTGHIPNKDLEVCGGTFTVASIAAAAIGSRRQYDDTKLMDGRTHSPRFADQLGSHGRHLRSYRPWVRQAAGVSHSFERYSRAAGRPACFAR
ncbi:Menaquinone-specific isochorismate synthase [Durusdinium trenchii]|uniref:Menaquinone-specific isochorismate synthase n=1 Tax=Durusdinium trenchii TaxID=1381693 RepID=A0ABP0HPL5_9DINO